MSEKKNTIKVQIAEDNFPVRNRYIRSLSSCEEFEIVAATGTMQDTIDAALTYHPDVILMDIEMDTKEAGLLATKLILSKLPDTKIIILTIYEDDQLVFTAFQLQACDYILKNADLSTIRQAIIDAFTNRSPIRPEIAGKLRTEFKRIKDQESSFLYTINLLTTLTPTELDILNLLADGLSRNEICRLRYIESSTVKFHIHNIIRKFGKKNIKDLLTDIRTMNILPFLEQYKK